MSEKFLFQTKRDVGMHMNFNHHNNSKWLHHHPKYYIVPMNYNFLDNTHWSKPHPKFYVIAITDITCMEEQ